MTKRLFELKTTTGATDILTDYTDTDAVVGASIVTDVTNRSKNETRSLFWRAQNGAQLRKLPISNWTGYSHLCFSVYSEQKYGNEVQLRINCKKRGQSNNVVPYFRSVIKVDWIGWKDFCICLRDLDGNYTPHYDNIDSISFDCSGWYIVTHPTCALWFGKMSLQRTEIFIEPPILDYGNTVFDQVKDNWRRLLLGTPENNLSGTEAMRRKLDDIERSCEAELQSLRDTLRVDQRDSLWGIEIVHGRKGDECKTDALYGRLYPLVVAYGTPGNKYYGDPDLLTDCKNGIEYLYRHYYGPCIIENGTYGNWWEWDIGIPLTLTKMLLILEKEYTPEQIKCYLSPFDYLDYYPRMTAANKTWVTAAILASAVLQNDAERILISKDCFKDVFEYAKTGDGFYTDGSFIQHGNHPYAGGYALSMMVTLSDIMYAFHDTMFEIAEGEVENQYAWVFDTYLPIMHKGNLFANTRGREVCRRTSETLAGNRAISSMVKMIHYAPADVAARLEALVKKHIATSGRDLTGVSSILFTDYIAGLADSAEAANTPYNVTKVFGNMDRVTHHNSSYAASVALNSTRIWKYEAIVFENMNAWYHGDGMLYLYTHGYDYNYDFFHYVNPYRIPGVTCTDQERVMENIRDGIFNGSPFAGGVQCGEYGIATMHLTPSENNYFISQLSAKKSYFFLGREVVAVGSGITDTSDANVYTVVENRKWRDSDEISINGKAIVLDTETVTKDAVDRVHFSGMGGYIFPKSVTLNMRRADNTVKFLEMWLEHGKSPQNEGYSYIYLPTATADETDAYDASGEIEILSATPELHAVKKSSVGVCGYVFFEAGECNGIRVSEPCAVMTEQKHGAMFISVSDPTHLLDSATVTVQLDDASKTVVLDSTNIKSSLDGNTLTLEVNLKDNVGQSFSVTVQSNQTL